MRQLIHCLLARIWCKKKRITIGQLDEAVVANGVATKRVLFAAGRFRGFVERFGATDHLADQT